MRNLTMLVLLLFVVAAGCGGDDPSGSTTQPREIPQAPSSIRDSTAALAPADAVALVQISSANRLNEIVRTMGDAFGAPESQDPLAEMTAGMGIDISKADRSRPLAIAVSLDPQMPMPMPTFIVPFDDPEAAVAAHQGGKAVMGQYAALSMMPEFKQGGSSLCEGLLGGDLSMRVDLKSLVATYRAQIDQGLGMAAEIAKQGAAASGQAFDSSAVTGAIFDWIGDLVASAETLDVVVNEKAGTLEYDVALTVAEGSRFDSSGGGKSNLRALASHLQGDYPMVMLIRFDMGGYMKLMNGMIESMAQAVPEERRAAFRKYMEAMNESMALVGDEWAMAFDFDVQGMRGVMAVRADDPAAYIESYSVLLQDPVLEELGWEVEDLGKHEVGGAESRRLRMKVDWQKYFSFLGMGQQPGMPDMAGMQPMFDRIMGKDGMMIDMVARDGMVIFGFDPTGKAIEAALAGGAPPATVGNAIGRYGGDLNFAMYLELRALAEGVTGMMRLADESIPVAPAGEPLEVTLASASDGRVHRFGMSLPLTKLGEFAKSFGKAAKPR